MTIEPYSNCFGLVSTGYVEMALHDLSLDLWSTFNVVVTLIVCYVLYLWFNKEHAPPVDFHVDAPAACTSPTDDLELLERPSIQVVLFFVS